MMKKIVLAFAVVAIAATIWYLEAHKAGQVSSEIKDITVPERSSANAPEHSASSTAATAAVPDRSLIIKEKAARLPHAKELAAIHGYINADQFKLADFVGKKVILIDFWTYSCINCQRTIPYLNAWYKKYKDKGFVIVGVHTPEFEFEKDYGNVAKAVAAAGIKYPVVLDSDYGTWTAYENRFWPREFLIDIDGFIVHDHIGEGAYDETERAIQAALKERGAALAVGNGIDTAIVSPKDTVSMDESKVASPEIYFGSARNEYLGNGARGVSGPQTLALPAAVSSNKLYLDGTWDFQKEFAENSGSGAKIIFKYNAKNVYLVASSDSGVKIKVLRDAKPLGADAGADVTPDGTILVKDNRLYKLIEGSDYGEHTIEIQIENPGLKAFTFTFG